MIKQEDSWDSIPEPIIGDSKPILVTELDPWDFSNWCNCGAQLNPELP